MKVDVYKAKAKTNTKTETETETETNKTQQKNPTLGFVSKCRFIHVHSCAPGGAHYGAFQMFGPGARDGVNDKMKAHFLKLLEAGPSIDIHAPHRTT